MQIARLFLLGLLPLALPPAVGAQMPTPVRDVPPTRTLQARTDVHCVYQDPVGFIWMCTDGGLVRFDGREEVVFARGVRDLRAILRRADGQYWVGGASGLYELQSKSVTGADSDLVRPAFKTPFSSVNGLIEFADGSLGCATDNGVWALKDGTLTELDIGLPPERSRRNVRVLFEFQNRSLWAGTSEGLYYREVRRLFSLWSSAGSSDQNGRLSPGRWPWDGYDTMHLTRADGLPSDDIQALARGPDQRLWVGTRRGLATVDVNALWKQGFGAVRSVENPDAFRGADVRAISTRRIADVWVGTSTGLVLLEWLGKGGAIEYRHQEATPPVRAFSNAFVLTDHDVRFAPWSVESAPNGGETVLTRIAIDGHQQPIPVNGLAHTRVEVPWRTQLVEIGFVRPVKELWRYAEESDRLGPPDQWYMVRTGDLSERNGTFSDIPPAWARAVRINDKKISGGLFVPLPLGNVPMFLSKAFRPDIGPVGPVVVRPSLQEGPPTAYASPYIETADTNGWLVLPEQAERRVIIEHPAQILTAGLHRLVVYGGRRGGPGDSASMDFVIAPAPWVRWWFVGPIAMVVAGTFLGYRVHRRRRAADISELRSRIAADLHDSVGASLSRIAILSDVLGQQVRERVPETASSLDAIGDNARAAIDEMNDAVWLIDPAIHTIGQLIVRVRMVAAQLFDPDVSWSVVAPTALLQRPLPSEHRRHLYLLMKEALTNVRRHARASSVAVRLSASEAGLRVEIEDDGTAGGWSAVREGNGFANMRTRAVALGGSVSIGNRGPQAGTRVVIQTAIR